MQKVLRTSAVVMLCGSILAACHSNRGSDQAAAENIDSSQLSTMLPDTKAFQEEIDGKATHLYLLKNKNGMVVAITNYGGKIVSLLTPDSSGKLIDVVLGYGSLNDYRNDTGTYFGALIGRYGNRIAKGKFTLDGKTYSLAINNPPNSLHGGRIGFNAKVWDAQQPDSQHLDLSYVSKDMEENYPGNLTVKVRYTLNDSNELKIDYEAVTDKNTVLNLTNHAYFNLSGEGYPTNGNTVLMINADHYTPVDSTLIPTGEIASVKGTPYDFTQPVAIGERIDQDDQQLKFGHGYDQNLVLNKQSPGELSHAATAYSPVTGIQMDVYTTEPGVQFYSGNFLDGTNIGISGKPYLHRSAFCLETQHYPDSPNHPGFPSTELKPGETFHSTTIYRFGIKQ